MSPANDPGELQRLSSLSGSSSSTSSDGGAAGGARPRGGFGARLRRAARGAASVTRASLMLLVRLVLLAATPLLVVLLRRLVRARRFWERGLASAWHDGSKLPREYIDAYRWRTAGRCRLTFAGRGIYPLILTAPCRQGALPVWTAPAEDRPCAVCAGRDACSRQTSEVCLRAVCSRRSSEARLRGACGGPDRHCRH